MTASREEAANIVAVMLRYMPFKTAQHMALELETEVSTYSNNESLRETIDLLKQFLSADNNECGDKCGCKEKGKRIPAKN